MFQINLKCANERDRSNERARARAMYINYKGAVSLRVQDYNAINQNERKTKIILFYFFFLQQTETECHYCDFLWKKFNHSRCAINCRLGRFKYVCLVHVNIGRMVKWKKERKREKNRNEINWNMFENDTCYNTAFTMLTASRSIDIYNSNITSKCCFHFFFLFSFRIVFISHNILFLSFGSINAPSSI